MSNEVIPKQHPGRSGGSDDSHLKRTYSLDVKLSPDELTGLKKGWKESQFNSMSAFVRNKIFEGNEIKVDLYWQQKDEERNINKSLLSQLNKLGNNMNQIAKQLNSKPEFLRQEATELLKSLQSALEQHEQLKQEIMKNSKN